ncbi:hypothetical protein M426DRAFT_17799 [Hypoxylon sp. CI-4A]|nr:hypothetical protein M426DRAFT_17799 [Hypoxylon sp. CI-4A]
MEHHRVPRHSSSHGTLHSSYSQGQSSHGVSPARPLHKPLRSVNENSVLLPSPGALESMLKTTTETGDIGIFTIKPVPPLPQRRDTLSEIGQRYPSLRLSTEHMHGNTGKKPTHFRDTTSEIVSMYGSESHKSATSILTPTSSEGVGHRSYSMTTCESRQLSHHRSTTTLQSQTSGGTVQRPRSPFPYPTRLKRPGVRPASPALTENGRVDYSRMVEIDRTSYRTVHGPYKPSYPSMPHRPPPLGLRTDGNVSTISLPSQDPYHSRYGPRRPSLKTYSAASMGSWTPPYRERMDSPSSRTSSLTSIVNMYHRMPPTSHVGPSGLSTATPRYYDYTEEFETRPSPATTPVQPLAPVPTRSSNYQRPLVLEESDDSLAAAFGEQDSVIFRPENQSPEGVRASEDTRGTRTPQAKSFQTALNRSSSRRASSIPSENRSIPFDGLKVDPKVIRGSDIDLLPSQAGRDSMDTFNPSLDLESRDAPAYRYTDFRSTTTSKTKANSPGRQVQVQGGRAPTIRSEQGVILRDDTQEETAHEGATGESDIIDPVGNQVITVPWSYTTRQRSFSEPVNDPSKDSIQQDPQLESQHKSATLSRVNSHYTKTDGIPTALHGSKSPNCSIRDSDVRSMETEDQKNAGDGDEDSLVISTSTEQSPRVAQRQNFQRHKRKQAVPRISSSSLPREDNEGYPHIPPSCSTTPIVSPKPISPARQLKLKNSIPQLMKALPPLPGDPDYVPPLTPSVRSTSSNEGDFAEVLAPIRFSQYSTAQLLKDTLCTKGLGMNTSDDRTLSLQSHAPKLKLKMKAHTDTGAIASSDIKLVDLDGGLAQSTMTPTLDSQDRRGGPDSQLRSTKLKLRSSKSVTTSTPPSATVRRRVPAEVSGFITNITQKPRDLLNFPPGLSPAIHPVNSTPPQPVGVKQLYSVDRVVQSKASPLPENRPGSANTYHHREATSGPGSMETCTGSPSRLPRGLKRRLSNLRYLLARPPDPSPTTIDTTRTGCKKTHRVGQLTNDPSTPFVSKHSRIDEHPTQEAGHRTTIGRRVRSKLFKWVKDAKVAVRVRGKKAHGS